MAKEDHSIAIVSDAGYEACYPIFNLALADLQTLSRLVEAYILHDKVIYFCNYALDVKEILDGDPSEILVSVRYDFDSKNVSPLIGPLLSPDTLSDREDLERMFRLGRDIKHGPKTFVPTNPRTPIEWLRLGFKCDRAFMQAEAILSEQNRATYYPSRYGAELLGEQLLQFGESAAAILQNFTNARSRQIAAVQKFIRPHEVELSPPLFLAYALSSAQTKNGFRHAIQDLRNDSRTPRLRKLVVELSTSEPHEQTKICKRIEAELWSILGETHSGSLDLAEMVQTVPTFFSDTWATMIKGACQLVKIDDLIDKLKSRWRVNMLRKLHRSVPSVKQFFCDLQRIFGPLAFNEAELRKWLANPGYVPSSKWYNPTPTQLRQDLQRISGRFEEINRRALKERSKR